MMDLDRLSARALAKAIQDGKVSSVEATTAAIERLSACHTLTNCLISSDREEALAAAKAADAGLSSGKSSPLAGVPLAHKDMFNRAGKIPSWGAKIRADAPAREDATPIARLKSAGALQIGALHLTEFAYGPTGHNYVLGHARNPWDPTRITGGSSSGTAAAVAYGAIPAGLGSDTAASLRAPAACCGVASIKPTWGRVSRAGAMPLSPQLDAVGVVARHVEDLALLLGLIAGPDPLDPSAANLPVPDYLANLETPVNGLKVGLDERLVSEAHPDVQRMLGTALDFLLKAGLKRTACTFADWQTIDHLTQLVQLPDAAAVHGNYIRTRANDYGPQVRSRVEFGHFISAVDHMAAKRARGTYLERVLDRTFKDVDVAILPVLADPLPTIAELDVGGGPQLQTALGRMVKFLRPINYLGLPVLTLPVPRNDRLPNGIQLIGKPFAEGLLMAIGQAYQREVPPEIARPLS